ncbi:MAG: RNA methyltransferase [Bacteroidales bacterium]|nr:RNA methyltransferase [Bacteroidales bacterium]
MLTLKQTLSKNDIKWIRSLGSKKGREELQLFIAEGEKLVQEALASSFEVTATYRLDEIGEQCMKQISQLSSPSPALAVIRIPQAISDADIDSIIAQNGLSLALDSVKDPGNMGTILRIADWFGIDAVFASQDSVDIYNPKVVQASMGAIFRKKVIYCDLEEIVTRYTDCGKPVYGTFLDGEDINSKNLNGNALIVMGSESNGISEKIAAHVTERLFIPPYPGNVATSESLNVAIATAITCAAFRRG